MVFGIHLSCTLVEKRSHAVPKTGRRGKQLKSALDQIIPIGGPRPFSTPLWMALSLNNSRCSFFPLNRTVKSTLAIIELFCLGGEFAGPLNWVNEQFAVWIFIHCYFKWTKYLWHTFVSSDRNSCSDGVICIYLGLSLCGLMTSWGDLGNMTHEPTCQWERHEIEKGLRAV